MSITVSNGKQQQGKKMSTRKKRKKIYIYLYNDYTYIITQINGLCKLFPHVPLISRGYEKFAFSTEDIERAHRVTVHVIIEPQTSWRTISGHRNLKLSLITLPSWRRRLNVHVVSWNT